MGNDARDEPGRTLSDAYAPVVVPLYTSGIQTFGACAPSVIPLVVGSEIQTFGACAPAVIPLYTSEIQTFGACAPAVIPL